MKEKTKKQLLKENKALRARLEQFERGAGLPPEMDEMLKRFREFFDKLPDYCYTISPDGRIMNVNQSALEALGYEKEELFGQNIVSTIYAPESRKKARTLLGKGKKAGKIQNAEMIILTKSGEERIVLLSSEAMLDEKGKIIHSISVQKDISERKRIENVLIENEQRFRDAFELAAIGRAITDPEGRFLKVNNAILEMSGYSEEELLKKSWIDVTHPDDVSSSGTNVEKLLKGKIRSFNQIQRVVHSDGHSIWVNLNVVLIRDQAGKPLYMVGDVIDITEQKKAEDELKRYQETLEVLVEERTAELETFAYSISPDLRAPLRAMEGFSNALVEDYGEKLDGRGQEYAERIIKAARRMDTLINDILTYSRISRTEIKIRPVDLNKAVKEATKQHMDEINTKKASVEIKGKLPKVDGHYPVIVQIISNLISNALKYVGPRTKPKITISADTKNDSVRLSVKDNGIGIEPKHQDKIFKIFERLHGIEHFSGTGIGLALVKKGVERMGGNVGVESKAKKGSKFWIELPKATTKKKRTRHYKGRGPL